MGEMFHIEGSGRTPTLEGTLRVAGAKNAVLKAIAASVLYDTPLTLINVPAITDVENMCAIVRALGATTTNMDNSLVLDTREMKGATIPAALMSSLRASIVLSGPLLARFGEVIFSHPGGDVIGERPIDLFLDTFMQMGAEVVEESGGYGVCVPQGLRGTEIFFRLQTVTGTETAMLAATRATGTTVLKNAAPEPEVVWLANLLNASGARVVGAGTSTVTIEGSATPLRAPHEYKVVPDRIEAGSFLMLGALAAKELVVAECVPEHLEAVIHLLRSCGVTIEIEGGQMRVRAAKTLTSTYLKTHEYPGFPTDLLAPMVTLLTQAEGESHIFETIWDNRLVFTEVLRVMGADITLMDPHRVLVRGPRTLYGKSMESPDIRAGLAFVIAAMIAEGESQIRNIHHIDRGYGHIAERLQTVGAKIKRGSA